jgi:hypothetical protein
MLIFSASCQHKRGIVETPPSVNHVWTVTEIRSSSQLNSIASGSVSILCLRGRGGLSGDVAIFSWGGVRVGAAGTQGGLFVTIFSSEKETPLFGFRKTSSPFH